METRTIQVWNIHSAVPDNKTLREHLMDIETKLRIQIDLVNAINRAIAVYEERGGSVTGATSILKTMSKDYKNKIK